MSKAEKSTAYDYVIVGAGSAGCVLAARLSEGDANVLLIEAGPPDTDPNIWIPYGWPLLWGTERDYAFETVPQTYANGRKLYWPRGRTLGGSSSLNGMVYVRGHSSDYDGWANDGCVGWDYASVLPYFIKSENYEDGSNAYHGTGGPLNVSRIAIPHPFCATAVQAGVDAGFPLNEDFNGATSLGVGFADLTVKDGRRQSAAAAFLSTALARPNLEILTGAQVTRLTFEGTRCNGIEYRVNDTLHRVAAESEVIVAGGVIGSPHLLMLSGIGDESELRSVGIDVVHHLPGVGKNLHDHLLCSVIYESSKELPPPQNNYLEAQMFWKSDARKIGPDLQPLFLHLPYYAPGLEGPTNAWTLAGGIVNPTSRGSMRLISKDPSMAPLLDPNILSTDADMLAMEASVRICIEIGEHPTLSGWRKTEVYPARDARSRNALHDYIRRSAVTYHHQVGTCKMGFDDDAVVDPQLRVRGITGLRVVDASIMPTVVSGNTNAPTIMIAEKGADMIRSSVR
jgi:choline dehydrogenase